jgi:hypothetical protein
MKNLDARHPSVKKSDMIVSIPLSCVFIKKTQDKGLYDVVGYFKALKAV